MRHRSEAAPRQSPRLLKHGVNRSSLVPAVPTPAPRLRGLYISEARKRESGKAGRLHGIADFVRSEARLARSNGWRTFETQHQAKMRIGQSARFIVGRRPQCALQPRSSWLHRFIIPPRTVAGLVSDPVRGPRRDPMGAILPPGRGRSRSVGDVKDGFVLWLPGPVGSSPIPPRPPAGPAASSSAPTPPPHASAAPP